MKQFSVIIIKSKNIGLKSMLLKKKNRFLGNRDANYALLRRESFVDYILIFKKLAQAHKSIYFI